MSPDVKLSAAAVLRRIQREIRETRKQGEWPGKNSYVEGINTARGLVKHMAEKARKR